MRDRLHKLGIARAVLLLEQARLAAAIAALSRSPTPIAPEAFRAAVARRDADLARLAREEAALRVADAEGP